MRHPDDISVDDRQTLIQGIHYMSFILNMLYTEFADLFLLKKKIGSTPRFIHDRYGGLGGNVACI